MTVAYRLEPTGRSEHEVREVLLTKACPTCGADWTRGRVALPRHGSGREYRCEACGEHHRATEVDADGRPVQSPEWGLAREIREREQGPPGT